MATWPILGVQIEFTPNSWTGITGRVKSVTANRGRQYELGAAQAGQMTVAVDNSDGALDPTNQSSPYWPNVKLFKRVQIGLSWQSVYKNLWTGYIERYPQSWGEAGNYQWTHLVAVDELAKLSQHTLEAVFFEAVKALNPSVWYPLDDAAGSANRVLRVGDAQTAGERAGGLGPAVFVTRNATDPLATLGSVSDKAYGQEGVTTANFTPPVAGSNELAQLSTLLLLPRGVVVPTSGPWTLALGFTGVAGTIAPAAQTLLHMESDDDGQSIQVGIARSQTCFIILADNQNAVTTINPNINVNDGFPHFVSLSMSADSKSITLTIDDNYSTTVYAAAAAGYTWHFNRLTITGLAGRWYGFISRITQAFKGSLAHFAIFPTALGVPNGGYDLAHQLAHAYLQGYDQDNTWTRFQRVAGYANLTNMNNTAPGNSTLQTAKTKGKTALQALQDTVTNENGLMFVDGDGVVWFVNRRFRTNRASEYVVGDQSAQFPYQSLTTDYDGSHLANDVTVSRANGVVARATSPASIGAYGQRTLSRTTEIRDDYETIDAANYLVGAYAQPARRVASVTLDMAATQYFQFVTYLEINQTLTVVRTPLAGKAFTQLCHVESVAYTIAAGVFTVTLQLSPADWDSTIFQLDRPVFDQLDIGNTLTY